MCADVSHHDYRVFFFFPFSFLGEGGRVWGCEGSFIVENKCMAHGSLIKKIQKKRKKILPHTFAMAAHIPQPHGDENHTESTDV